MRKEFDKSLDRIRRAIDTMEFVGRDCSSMIQLLESIKNPRSVEDKSYCTVVMLASHTCVIISRYYEDVTQMDVKRNILQNKLYTPEIGSKLARLNHARDIVVRNVECYQQLLDYRCLAVKNICSNVPFKNRYYR